MYDLKQKPDVDSSIKDLVKINTTDQSLSLYQYITNHITKGGH